MRPTFLQPTNLAMAVALTFCSASTALFAVTSNAAESVQHYDIAPGSLEQTLRQIARQSGRGVIADPALVRGKASAAVRGNLSAEAAAYQALAGSGLQLRVTPNGTLTLEKNTASNTLQLGATSVLAQGLAAM